MNQDLRCKINKKPRSQGLGTGFALHEKTEGYAKGCEDFVRTGCKLVSAYMTGNTTLWEIFIAGFFIWHEFPGL